ncbi:RNA polymerase sporulation-specific sigma factor [Thermoanaerobacter uzonensis DSM 18761]|jgi:RNA polymerase sporulation-specific sigma factor|uniref:RNA polymerase sporulation-specific sigma factor n=1 Tax=Thermoanaerobacter uzonensis DSM 18761 TaxID=1123369 RepID=A0A1M4TG37_9THEO|nr:sigma factor-like helix-turn-helix DNA-binding protein [Thermoanaerobacter uzonensis]SHE43406.1 RNA polymerase sporulation-specific sigma factor [Thermoanaerobacter uzonensis DSM 18761]
MKENEVEFIFIGYLARYIKFESIKLKKKYQEVKYRELLILDAPRNNVSSESKDEVVDNITYSYISFEDEVIDKCMLLKYKELLEPEEFEVLMLNVVEGISQEEIASMLSKTQSCISKIKKKALQKLKEFIKEV